MAHIPFSTEPGAPLIVQADNGRFFINMGRPGFNCRANNRDGFDTLTSAEQASAKFGAQDAIGRAQRHDPAGVWTRGFDRKGRAVLMFVPAK